jgi:hypothetical protein
MIKDAEESLITVCCYCHAVRIVNSTDVKNQQWASLEPEILRLKPNISHGYCPECYETIVLPMLEELEEEEVYASSRRF